VRTAVGFPCRNERCPTPGDLVPQNRERGVRDERPALSFRATPQDHSGNRGSPGRNEILQPAPRSRLGSQQRFNRDSFGFG
jgi:hypothetical protein